MGGIGSIIKEISIHAPARGATFGQCPKCKKEMISIHAPARGATVLGYVPPNEEVISIHAPARGATEALLKIYRILIFQSTLPRGERQFA